MHDSNRPTARRHAKSLWRHLTQAKAAPLACGGLLAWSSVSPGSAWGTTWAFPAATLPDRGRALDTVLVMERTTMGVQTEVGEHTVRARLPVPLMNLRWGITDRLELSAAMLGVGLRVQVLDTTDTAIPWHMSLAVHTDSVGLLSIPNFGPFDWNHGGGLQVGVDGTRDRKVGWRPTLSVTAQSADSLVFHVAGPTSAQTTASASAQEAELSAVLSQPRLHTVLLLEVPIAVGERRALTPGLGLDHARSIGEGQLAVRACESCGVALSGVSTDERLGALFSLRFEPRAGAQITRRRD